MSDAILLEASFFQLKSAISSIDDPMFNAQLKLTMDVLSNAIAAAGPTLNPSSLGDIEFALNDVAATVGELNAADNAAAAPAVEMMQADVAKLKEEVTIPQKVVDAVRDLQARLRERRTAIERAGYRAEGAPEEKLPHHPFELAARAEPVKEQLAKSGYATPALDELLADPEALRFHSIGDVLDELDVIVG